MFDSQVKDRSMQWIGEEWIQAVVGKDFRRLAEICLPEVQSRLMTPKRMDTFEAVTDLILKVEKWFGECSSFEIEQSRIAMVGEKLAIFYRLTFEKSGQPITAEQQIYCSLRDGLIDQLNLLCSGFQPVHVPDAVPNAQSLQQVAAFLKIDTGRGQASTCAILTPNIKRKLSELNSGQVLEVQVDDPSARGDIEAWCRLSGNTLLKMDLDAGQDLHIYLQKK